MSDAPELGESKDVMCPRTLTGTFLKIQKMDKNVLNIAEVQTILSNDGSNGC